MSCNWTYSSAPAIVSAYCIVVYTTTTTALLLYFMNNNCINAQVLVTMRRTERNRDEAILQCSQGLNSNHMNAAMAWHGNIFLR